MEKLRFWWKPVALMTAWLVVAAYVLFRFAQASQTPVGTFIEPTVIIESEKAPGT